MITHSGGIGYEALNIYFSAWLTFFLCAHTLNDWSASKDLISVQELTHLSATLKPWYALFFSSLVQMGSAADALSEIPVSREDGIYAVALGAFSTFISCHFILIHYKLVRCCNIEQGGMLELGVASLLIIWWIIG